jgi:hypothetical protein
MGSGGIAPTFLTAAVDGGEWSASQPCRFNPGERIPATYWTGDQVDSKAVWMLWSSEKISCSCRESKPGHPVHSLYRYRLSYSGGIPSFTGFKVNPVKHLKFLNDEQLPLPRAIAQAVSRWLPTAAAWVRARVWSCGICGGQSGAGAGFLRVLRFPQPIFIPPIAPQSPSSIIWGLYNRPEVAAVRRDLVPPH